LINETAKAAAAIQQEIMERWNVSWCFCNFEIVAAASKAIY
jgi:hypothetical protein